MNKRQPTLIEILQPPLFGNNPKRAAVTITVVQPEIDRFEQAAEGLANGSLRDTGRSGNASAPGRGPAQACLPPAIAGART